MYTRKERKIFKFFNGTKMVGIDPLEADMRLGAVDLNWEERYLTITLGVQPGASLEQRGEALEAIEEMSKAATKVFGLKQYEIAEDGTESGLTTMEIHELLGKFVEWKEEVRSFFESTPTSLPPTGVDSAAPTESIADSTSTSTVS